MFSLSQFFHSGTKKSKAIRAVLTGAAILVCSLASGSRASAVTSTDWPQLGRFPNHHFLAADGHINVGNASQFGVKWMANIYSADLGSPVVAYNSVLKKTVVYVGNNRADVVAVDGATGQTLWSTNVGLNDKMQATPVIAPDGTVWVATSYNPTLYKLDGSTGKVLCSVKSPSGLPLNGSPMVVTPTGGVMSVYWDTIDAGVTAGPVIATNESNCKTIWSFSNYIGGVAGPWVTPAYGVSKSGEPLIFFGTADTDSAEYALDANTGKVVWDYIALNPPPGIYDIGDAATVSAPGNNGFADGVVYVDTKYGREYAIDLTTGALIWQFVMTPNDSRASAALDGTNLVVGYVGGVYNLNAVTGAMNWLTPTPAEVLSSPAVVGQPGSEIVAIGDVTGAFRLLSLANGSQLYKYQTGGFITASAAEDLSEIFQTSSDGFLYAYGVGGGNSAPPSTAITSPVNLSKIPNPNGDLTITGSSSDPTGVTAVEVAIQQNGTAGPWYNSATGSYQSAPYRNSATLDNPGAKTSTWKMKIPAPAAGGVFTIFANSVNAGHIVDRGANSNFTMSASQGEPNVVLSTAFIPPGGSFTARSTAFKPGEQVVFTLLGATVATTTATKSGYVPKTLIKVPNSATFGATSLTLTGQTSGKTTTATVGITNNWTQLGHDPERTSFEPNDPVIADTISIGPKNTVLSQAWMYSTGSPVNTSPAVVDGIAYVGNDAGVLSAIVTNTGAPQWTYATPSHAPIHSSPGVDSGGHIIFGSNDGNLYKLTKTGSVISTLSLGGNLSSPLVDNDQIFIGSDNGHLYNVADTANTVTWTATLGGPVHSSPSYDSVAKLVFIGDDSGAVTALNSTTGAQVWKFATGGQVVGAPLIYNKTVFVGSADSTFYALNEATGAVTWTFKGDSPVTAGAALFQLTASAPIGITFGTQKGTVYKLSPAGVLAFTLTGSFTAPIVGISGVQADSVVLAADGSAGLIRINAGVPFLAWKTVFNSPLTTSSAIVDGAAYIGDGDGGLYAFTPHGVNPVPAQKLHAPIVTITDAWTCSTQP